MKTLTARFSTLSREVSANARSRHVWRKRAKHIKDARTEAETIGYKAMTDAGFTADDVPVFSKVKVSITLIADSKLATARKCYVPRDIQNLIAAVKPHIDGLKDAGWIKDDDKKAIIGYDEVQIITGKAAQGKCELSITFKECEG